MTVTKETMLHLELDITLNQALVIHQSLRMAEELAIDTIGILLGASRDTSFVQRSYEELVSKLEDAIRKAGGMLDLG